MLTQEEVDNWNVYTSEDNGPLVDASTMSVGEATVGGLLDVETLDVGDLQWG